MTPRIRQIIVATAVFATSSAFTAFAGQAPNPLGEGCMAIGDGPTVLDTHCNYFAPDDTQNVIVAMQHSFEIYVTRCCSKLHPDHCPPLIRPDGLPPTPDDEQCLEPAGADGRPLNVPKQFILLQRDDSTLPTGPPLKVHPIPGEYVHVHVGSGAGGFISVGQDEAIVPGGIPFP